MEIDIQGLKFFMTRYRKLAGAVDKLLDDAIGGQFTVGDEMTRVDGIIGECERLIEQGVNVVRTMENEG